MSYIKLRDHRCDIIVMNVHAPTEDKIDDIKDRFYEELEHVFDKFPKYPMKILLGDFNAKVTREDIFKPTIGNESLHEIDRRRQSSILDVRSFRAADCDTNHCLVVAKVRERLAVRKQTTHRVRLERFNLEKLNEVVGKEPVTVAERSKACAVFARSEAGIMGSNPTQDMDV
ncbi:hypothetical protein B7P43_G13213 [Cryptotermes secundus]|uniref:Endonuclease/exonuclease/phosphatase domain-containing protein n=1 Tax=Cryptotermes secundus TaxID=105785 RepID=A0A2J7PVH3_9NEOP|nr:hypothetical protein B7P43_G13213 [Cryptotermes secundus]